MANSPITAAQAILTPEPIMLWSTGTHLKHYLQTIFGGRKHYVWCSPNFEGDSVGRYSVGANPAPSSDPATIYRQLHQAVTKQDRHDPKIASQAKTLKALAVAWHKEGKIDADARDEMIAIVKGATIRDFRPIIYAIPYVLVRGRVNTVPRKSRASHEPEFRIFDLDESEFQLIEPVPCN